MLIVTLPLPLKELSPNARCHWAAKSRAKAKYRRWAAASATCTARKAGWQTAATVRIQVVLYARDRRSKWDRDNLIAAMKAAVDGLQDAGIVANDSGVLWDDPEIVHGDKDPRVELRVRERSVILE